MTKEGQNPISRLKRAFWLIYGIPRTKEQRERQERYLVFRHLLMVAVAMPIGMWLFGIPAFGFGNRRVCEVGICYFLLVLGWAVVGSRYITYVILFALGGTLVAIPTLWSTLVLLQENGKEDLGLFLVAVYTGMAVVFSILGYLNWHKGIPQGTQPLIDERRGTFDLGGKLAFFRNVELGRAEESKYMSKKDKTWFRKWGWIVYLILFMTPIVSAWIISGRLNLPQGATFEILALYGMALLFGLGGLAGWQRAYWFWRWERERKKPMLVKQFADRHHRRRDKG